MATFTAAGTVLHIVENGTGTAHGPTPDEEPKADPEAESLLRECCRVPATRSTRGFLRATVLVRRAHFARPHAGPHPPHRRALLYPVRPGRAGELWRLLAAGIAPGTSQHLSSALVSSTVYARGDTVVRFWEATADADEEVGNLVRVVPYSGLGAKLNDLLDFDQDLTTESGFRTFFTRCAMTLAQPLHPHPSLPSGTARPEEEA
ncbi:SchA/CurD-like domain-containing protein [Streptomyces sp. NPDC086554]|uniref:SchA/CurD-like domain-containing protein n=1 Tax=Streptomyces sp. NPDC086554 TaxID=3154864 RepID=UPI003446EC50